jgi:hypothetical protein
MYLFLVRPAKTHTKDKRNNEYELETDKFME